MELKEKPPPGRSIEGLTNHYVVEKSIADRLKAADAEGRKQIYHHMYDELFQRVPDHPRLVRRDSAALTKVATRDKLDLIRRFLSPDTVFAEFAPGDCKLSFEAAGLVRHAYGIDISDQRDPADPVPDNFTLIVYDGYALNAPPDGSVDVMFSDQLIEHFHPDDTRMHFEIVYRLLKPGGRYIFRTPHWLTGPHDISRYFSDEPECFHLKEWTYRELHRLLRDVGYSSFRPRWRAGGMDVRMPYLYFAAMEGMLGLLPKRRIRGAAMRLIPAVYGVAVK